jgi:hypothetical protein
MTGSSKQIMKAENGRFLLLSWLLRLQLSLNTGKWRNRIGEGRGLSTCPAIDYKAQRE